MQSTTPLVACIFILATTGNVRAGGPLSFQAVAKSGQTAPGTTRIFSFFNAPYLSDTGRIVFSAFLTGMTSSDEGIWSGLPGGLQVVAREGTAAPGTPAGVVFAGGFVAPIVNASGAVLFVGSLSGSGVDSTNSKGIWAGPAGGLVLVSRTGSQAPGTPAGVVYAAGPTYPAFNNAGQVAFMTRLAGMGVDGSNDFGIWAGTPGALQLVAREGDAAPGMDGALFGPFYDQFLPFTIPVMNSGGEVVFRAYTTAGTGIWRWSGGVLELIARSGGTAPGTSTQYDYFGEYPHINAQGQVAYFAGLVGEGVDSSNNSGVWTGTPGALQLVVRKGAPAPGAAGLRLGPQYSTIGNPAISDDGFITFPGYLLDDNNMLVGRGIWGYGGAAGSWGGELIVRENASAPGLSGVTFASIDVRGPQATSSTPFYAYLSEEGVPGTRESLWLKDVGSVPSLIVRQGDPFDIGGGVFRTVNYINAFPGTGNWAPFYNASRQMVMGLTFTDNSSGIFTANIPMPARPGDMNCDGEVNGLDAEAFALAVLNPAGYSARLPNCNILNGDINQDTVTSVADTDLFAECLLNGGCL